MPSSFEPCSQMSRMMSWGRRARTAVSAVRATEAARAEAVMESVARGYRLETGRDCTPFTTRPAAGARLVPRGTGATPAAIS